MTGLLAILFWSARSCMCYAEADKTLAGIAKFLSDPKRPIERALRAMMTTPHLDSRGVHPIVASVPDGHSKADVKDVP